MAIVSRETAPVDLAGLPGRGQYPAIDTYVRPRYPGPAEDGGLAQALKQLGANLSSFAAEKTAEQKKTEMENIHTYINQASVHLRNNPDAKWDDPAAINDITHPLHATTQMAIRQKLGEDRFREWSVGFMNEYTTLSKTNPSMFNDPAAMAEWLRRKKDEATALGGSVPGYSGGWNRASTAFFSGMLDNDRKLKLNEVREGAIDSSKGYILGATGGITTVSKQSREVVSAMKTYGITNNPTPFISLFTKDDGTVDLDIKNANGESIFGFDENTPDSTRMQTILKTFRDAGVFIDGPQVGIDAMESSTGINYVKAYELIYGKSPNSADEAREKILKGTPHALRFLGVADRNFTVNKVGAHALAAQGLPPIKQAFLNAISGPEAAGKYNIRYTPNGGTTFVENGQHPGIRENIPWRSDGLRSDAAGRYQFLSSTWRSITGGNVPFTRENQDIYALKLAERDYARVTKGGNLWRDLETQPPAGVLSKLKGTWEGLGNRAGLMKAIKWYGDTLNQQVASR